MTKEIREGIKLHATGACIYQDGSYPCPINFETNDEVCLDCLMKKLDKLGVVLKVDRKCSVCIGTGFINRVEQGNSTVCPVCIGTGKHVATEPLIEEKIGQSR